MKKLVSIALFAFGSTTGIAQISSGGFPWSRQIETGIERLPVTMVEAPPEVVPAQQQKERLGPALVARTVATQLSFPQSGYMTTLADGTRIWQAWLNMPGAKAIGLYYSSFHLPEGVKFYLSNSNGKQVLGAFTAFNNDPGSNKFATEPVAGERILLELDIPATVTLADISLNIDKAASYFAGIEQLRQFSDYQTLSVYDIMFTGASSVCMINALCPEGTGYEAQRDAALNILFPITENGQQFVGTCSATMVNTAANTPSDCKQYALLASHCMDGTNTIADSSFSQVILRFNYQHTSCNPAASAVPNTDQTSMIGARFVARSILPLKYDVNSPNDSTTDVQKLKGDFMLLELKSPIPVSWNINLAGWNNAANIPLTNSGNKKFIGFHHPGGDVKKVSFSHAIQSNGGIADQSSHWHIAMDSGLVARGTSGSALFDGDGRDIGVASFAALGISGACATNSKGEDVSQETGKTLNYSKMSYIWDYSVDGPAAIRKLKPWLDPANSNVVTVNAVKSDCRPINGGTGISMETQQLEDAVNIFPNPVRNSFVHIQVNLKSAAHLVFELFDIAGKKIGVYDIGATRKQNFIIDLSGKPNGMYLLKCSDGNSSASKKIMLIQ